MTELAALDFDPATAERLVEDLRYGTPPTGFVREFTIGRQSELEQLESTFLNGQTYGGALVQGDYGGGKTHLLNLIRDMALRQGYVVSLVTVNAGQGVRFNRIEQVLTAVCRGLELPTGEHGILPMFRAYVDHPTTDDDADDRDELEDGGRWQQQGLLRSYAVWACLRSIAVLDDSDVHDLVQEWLTAVEPSRISSYRLASDLIDPPGFRSGWSLNRSSRFFNLKLDEGIEAWKALDDLSTIARLSGFKGLVVLFDEFEDVIQNLNNKNLEVKALQNMLSFFDGGLIDVLAYFAVTPDFVAKATNLMLRKGMWHFDCARLDELPTFRLSPVTFDEFLELIAKIMLAHARAYEWDPTSEVDWDDLGAFLNRSWQPHAPERLRVACRSLIDYLDDQLDAAAA